MNTESVMSDIQENLINEYARSAATIVSRKTIRAMQRVTATLSGDDSGLINAWDEICVQIQGDKSSLWYLYIETLENFVRMHVEELSECDLRSLWLQTEAGFGWQWDIENSDEDSSPARSTPESQIIPHNIDEIVPFIVDEYILSKAGYYSNKRIREYLELADRSDEL